MHSLWAFHLEFTKITVIQLKDLDQNPYPHSCNDYQRLNFRQKQPNKIQKSIFTKRVIYQKIFTRTKLYFPLLPTFMRTKQIISCKHQHLVITRSHIAQHLIICIVNSKRSFHQILNANSNTDRNLT